MLSSSFQQSSVFLGSRSGLSLPAFSHDPSPLCLYLSLWIQIALSYPFEGHLSLD